MPKLWTWFLAKSNILVDKISHNRRVYHTYFTAPYITILLCLCECPSYYLTLFLSKSMYNVYVTLSLLSILVLIITFRFRCCCCHGNYHDHDRPSYLFFLLLLIPHTPPLYGAYPLLSAATGYTAPPTPFRVSMVISLPFSTPKKSFWSFYGRKKGLSIQEKLEFVFFRKFIDKKNISLRRYERDCSCRKRWPTMQRGSIISCKIIAQLFLVIIIIVIIIKSLYIYRLVEYLKSFSFLFLFPLLLYFKRKVIWRSEASLGFQSHN